MTLVPRVRMSLNFQTEIIHLTANFLGPGVAYDRTFPLPPDQRLNLTRNGPDDEDIVRGQLIRESSDVSGANEFPSAMSVLPLMLL